MENLNVEMGNTVHSSRQRQNRFTSTLTILLIGFTLFGQSLWGQGLTVESLELWVADADMADQGNFIKALAATDEVDANTYPNIGIIATIDDPNGEFQKVEFYIDGAYQRAEAGAPYSLMGDRYQNGLSMLNAWNPGLGVFEVQAIPVKTDGSYGTAYTSIITFAENQAPVANDFTITIANQATATIDLTAEVTDADGTVNWRSLAIQSSVNGNSVPNSQEILFTPTATDAIGSITYTVEDNEGKSSNVGTITVQIGNAHAAPALTDMTVGTEVNTPVSIDVAGAASDDDGINPTSLVLESSPASGRVDISNGQLIYSPATDFTGTVSMQVSIEDLNSNPKRSRIATITVVIGNQGLESRYDSYEPTVAGVWRYEIIRPEFRFDMSDLINLYQAGEAVTVNSSMSIAQIEDAISNAPYGGRVIFKAGTYNSNEPLNIRRGDIRLESEGPVVFNCNFSGGWQKFGVDIQGSGATGLTSYISSGLEDEHTYTLTLRSAAGFNVGDWVRVVAYATAKSYSSGNQINLPNGVEVHRMATMCKIAELNGNTIELDRKPAFPVGWVEYPEYAEVQQWRMIENIAFVGDFTISYTDMLGVADAGDNGNDNSWSAYAAGVAGFFARNVANLGMLGIRTENTPSASMWVNHCADVYLEDCGSYGAHNRGSGGQGYAMLHEGCTNIMARNWHDERMRHSWATSLNTSSVALDVEISYTESNPEFSHGGFDRLQSFRVDVIAPHQEGERYRIFDHREVKVLRRNVGWVGTFAGEKPFGEYDNSLRTLPGTDATYDLRNLGGEHKPGFRDAPNSYYETYVGDRGFNTLYIIAMGHGNRIIINPGNHYFNTNNPRGNTYFIAPSSGTTPIVATIDGFRVNPERVRRADLIIIPAQNGIDGYEDVTITGERNAVITLANGGSITLNGIPASYISEEHVKVMSISRMDRIHHRMGVQYTLKGDDPYVVRTLVDLNGSSPKVKQVWNRPVSFTGGASAKWLTPGGSVIQTIDRTNTVFSGDTVIYTLNGVSEGDVIKMQLDPGFYQDQFGNRAHGIYDWHESVVHSTTFYSEAVWFDEAFNEDGYTGGSYSSSEGDGSRESSFPVELLYFRAEANPINNQVDLYWETASELNNDFFLVERSLDGASFIAIDQVDGSGTTETNQSYQAIDRQPLLGKAFYRLRQVDFDGSFTYSDMIEVSFSNEDFSSVNVYPSPARIGEEVSVEFHIPEAQSALITIVNQQGQTVYKTEVDAVLGNTTFRTNPGNLMPGIYFVNIVDPNQPEIRLSEKLLLQF